MLAVQVCGVRHGVAGWDDNVLQKLPLAVRARFRFVLTHRSAVTDELHQRIIDARVHGGSLKQLKNELNRNRHTRMHETIAAYYRHCEHYKLSRQINKTGGQSSLLYMMSHSQGAPHTFNILRPELQPETTDDTGAYYYDWPAPSVHFMGERQQVHAKRMEPIWKAYTQRLTADRVCIDATFKVPMKLTNTSMTRLWSMMDVETGCLLHQQMLTHEAHEDVLPMLMSYALRCQELGRTLPTHVCSDRGLMDARVLHDVMAFPCAHITVDPWHFRQRFVQTLNKTGSSQLWRRVEQEFNHALYRECTDTVTGAVDHTHAEPEDIINKINSLISMYSNRGTYPTPVISKATEEWWAKQIEPIRHHRILSHPRPNDPSTHTMASQRSGELSSSPQPADEGGEVQ